MQTLLLVIGYVIAAAAISCAVFYFGVLLAVLAAIRGAPSLKQEVGDDAANSRSLCVLIPAHNEERIIGRVARSVLNQQYDDLRIVFVLDRCTDGTVDELRRVTGDDERVEILENDTCPDDWAGKSHALWQGVHHTRGARDAELLLFLDADTELEPRCLRRAVAVLTERDADLLSALSTLESHTWWEHVCQPAAVFELMSHFSIRNVNKGERSFANGQFMLWKRSSYDQIGGHEAVRSDLLEDIALARVVRRAGLKTCLALADGQLHCRMYPDLSQFRRGWKRIYTEGAKLSPDRLRRWRNRLLITEIVLPVVSLISCAGAIAALAGGETQLGWTMLVTGVLGYGFMTLAFAAIHRSQTTSVWSAILHPIGAIVIGRLLGEASRDLRKGAEVHWGGRSYVRPVR